MKYEFKYVVPLDKLDDLRSRISPFMVHDEYMKYGGPQGYTVKSIYCDTEDFTDYHEKYSGIKIRKKLRIRGYNTEDPDNIIFLEVKRKNEKKIYKNRAPVKFKNLRNIITTGDIDSYVENIKGFKAARQDAKHFLFKYYAHRYRPVVTVIYDREAFHGAFDKSFRITFDKNLRSVIHPSFEDLYSEENIKYSNNGKFIFEVKFFHLFPSWLKSIVETLKLDLRSFSKYTTCVDEHGAVNNRRRCLNNDYVRQVCYLR